MAVDARLQLSDGSNTYTFDVGGAPRVTWVREFKTNAEPPELVAIEERWEITGARITGTTLANLWSNLSTFLGHLEDRTSDPVDRAFFQRNTGGGWTTTKTLGQGGTNHQEFRIEDVSADPEDAAMPAASWRSIIPINMTLVARRVFADGNGIVGWDQQISTLAGPDGLLEIEWQTELSVAEGAATSALAQAQTHAVIPIADYGNTYTFDTNSEDGFDYEYLDADEASSRTPTRIRCTSRIVQHGVTIGTPTAGNSVGGRPSYSVDTITEGQRTIKIYRASATGPGALAWCKGIARPSKQRAYSREFTDNARRNAEVEYHVIEQDTVRWEVEATVSGGGQDFALAETGRNQLPVPVYGTLRGLRLELAVTVKRIGANIQPEKMRFPAILGTPWVISHNETRENSVPRRTLVGTDKKYDEWERKATVVYYAPSATDAAFAELRKLADSKREPVLSYVFRQQGAPQL